MKIRILTIVLLLALATPAALPADDDNNNSNAAATITMEELRDHMFYLASDELGGRIWNKPGFKLAADYAASQFRAAGIKPLVKDENGKLTYLQEVIIQETIYSDSTLWTLTIDGEKHEYKAGGNIKTGQPGPLLNSQIDNFYFLGFGISEPEHGWDDVKDLDLSDKTIVVTVGTPTKNGKPLLPEDINKKYDGLQGLGYKLSALKKKGALRIALLSGGELDKFWVNLYDVLSARGKSLGEKEGSNSEEDNLVSVILHKEAGKLLFEGNDYSPYSGSEEDYKTFPIAGTTLALKAEKQVKKTSTWNVVGVIPGSDETLKDEYVVLGGHLDHIPPVKGQVCNGADDNASGSIGVIEAGEALAMQNHKRSILLCLWSAEEIGLFGSKYFVKHSPVDLEKIKVNINLDMIARSDKKHEKDRAVYCLGTGSGAPSFKEFIQKVNTDTVKWPLDIGRGRLGGGGSDHASFTAKGIPAVFFFSGSHKDYHKPTDDPENLDWEKFLNVSRLACNLTGAMADTDMDISTFKKVKAEKKEVTNK